MQGESDGQGSKDGVDDGAEEQEDDEAQRATDLERLKEDMNRIPLKTLLKAQKKLAAKSTSSRKASTSAAEDAEVPAKQRKGRLAPRRDMAPDLLKSKAEVDEAKNRHKPRVRQSRDNKHVSTIYLVRSMLPPSRIHTAS